MDVRSQLAQLARERGLTLELGPSEFGVRAALRLPERSASGDWFFLTADALDEERALRAALRALKAAPRGSGRAA